LDIFPTGREILEDEEIKGKRDFKVSECHNELVRKVSEMEEDNGDCVEVSVSDW
jgi:rRNA maturation endonuclease Nob1